MLHKVENDSMHFKAKVALVSIFVIFILIFLIMKARNQRLNQEPEFSVALAH